MPSADCASAVNCCVFVALPAVNTAVFGEITTFSTVAVSVVISTVAVASFPSAVVAFIVSAIAVSAPAFVIFLPSVTFAIVTLPASPA